ncbi:MAG: hypothetical protein ACI33J_06855 [Clostridium sp.]
MIKEEIENIPSALVSCIINDKEVTILKMSTESLTIRVLEKIEYIKLLKISFYNFKDYKYKEIEIKNFTINNEDKNEFYYTYNIFIDDKDYVENVKYIFRDYSKYVNLKVFGEENEFSKEMTGYPNEKDYEFYEYYNTQKKEWISNLNYKNFNMDVLNSIEMAITLDNDDLYEKYIDNDKESFKEYYFKKNFLENHMLFKKNIERLYIGNEFCHNLFPSINDLIKMLEKAKEESINVTLCFTYIRECYIQKTKDIIEKVYDWCKINNFKIEIVINDWGMLELLKSKENYFTLCLGNLLNKRKKDPRYIYKNGYEKNKELLSLNSLNSKKFREFLKDNNIERYEYESCNYKIAIPEGKHSLHFPFYMTNSSQYCPLYAMCTTMNRGNQKLVKTCPKYCRDYVFLYPKHLKMIGKYNSLFAFDDTLLKDKEILEYYINNNINRVVLNFL